MINFRQIILGTAIGRMVISLRDAIEILRAAYFNPEFVGTIANDQLATALVTRICLPGKTFVDVGAHIGSIVAGVAHHDASINIIAIEAIPEKVINLRQKFPSAEFHECAVGELEGEASFFINTKQSGYSSLGRPTNAAKRYMTEVKVTIKRLDALVALHNIDVIKIDVEGAELGVLRGSAKILATSRPTVMFESAPHGENDLGYTKEALWQFFAERKYTVLVPNRVAHNDNGLSQEGFVESHVYPRRTTNYFAIPNERCIEIRDRARNFLNIVVG